MSSKKESSGKQSRRRAPALTPEARENQMIGYAVDLAEKQLLDGTASSQVISHYLKLGTTREQLEKEQIIHKNALLQAQAEQIKSEKNIEQLMKEAISAMSTYKGNVSDDEEEEY